ncbi:MAG: family 16 glycoside hydrolase [Planctomycetota bacterium]
MLVRIAWFVRALSMICAVGILGCRETAISADAPPLKRVASREWTFDDLPPGTMPPGFAPAETNGRGKVGLWQTVTDTTAPSPPNAFGLVKTENRGETFNLAIVEGATYDDLDLSVRFKAVQGKEDQGGGPIWRCKDANNYYIVRANPLEGNFRIYKVVAGWREQLASANAKMPSGQWREIRIVMLGDQIAAWLDGKALLQVRDAEFQRGKIGLWTKADAVTYFDNLSAASIALDGAGLFKSRCVECHSLDRVLEKRDYTADDWRRTVDNMLEKQGARDTISEREAAAIAEFLSDSDWGKQVNAKEAMK